MRHAFFGDIHGNLDAFEAIAADIKAQNVDSTYCLGDIVGYGAQPSECLALIRQMGSPTVAGNHDFAAAEKIPLTHFNDFARAAMLWTRDHLSVDERAWLADLPLVRHLEDFTLVHATLVQPELFYYIETIEDARDCFRLMEKPLCFIGHSHLPVVFIEHPDAIDYQLDFGEPIPVASRMIVNPGSVGQPRDEDPRAAYCIYDTEQQSLVFRRVSYDIASAARKVREAGLPEILAFRLEIGR